MVLSIVSCSANTGYNSTTSADNVTDIVTMDSSMESYSHNETSFDNGEVEDIHGKNSTIKQIEEMFEFASPNEERFDYAFKSFSKGKTSDGNTHLVVVLLVANVSGKAINVNDFNEYLPSLVLVLAEDEEFCYQGIKESSLRLFNRYEHIEDESIFSSYDVIDTSIWLDNEAVSISYGFDVPENIADKDFKLVVDYRQAKIIITDSLSLKLNELALKELRNNVDVYLRCYPITGSQILYIFVVNREEWPIMYRFQYSVDISYEKDDEIVTETLWNVRPAVDGIKVKSDEAFIDTIWIPDGLLNYLKTGIYTITVKYKGEIIKTMQYLLLDETTCRFLIKENS